jgi:hypothetical protein
MAATPPSPAVTAGRLATPAPREKFGLLRPFHADQARDLVQGSGDDLLASEVGQVLGSAGEFPWRPGLNSLLDRVRNIANRQALSEFARAYVSQILSRYVPEVVAVSVSAERSGRMLTLTVTCSRVSDVDKTPARTFDVAVTLPA